MMMNEDDKEEEDDDCILTGFYQQLKSFWSCSHMNCCLHYMLHINLHILLLFKSRQVVKFKNQENPTST